ncbi:MAG TPA: LuxR C-terminal-related transcriptional regulator [Polyangia bacterium]|nr:LuxR C-terminal-related transcriptional regulator [Polyangia bacterium]
MAKLVAMRAGESRRISPDVWPRTGAAGRDADGRHPDLVATAVLAALDVALDAMQMPALVADPSGEIVCANAKARAITGDGPQVGRLARPVASASGGAEAIWQATPIGVAGLPDWSLLILHPPGPTACRRWNLTTRQAQVLGLVARGLTNTGIAETLGIRPGTVEFHVSAIFDKVGVNSRAALIACVMGG